MTDREFADVLVQKARSVLDEAIRDLRSPQSEDGKTAPHVAYEKLQKLDRAANRLLVLAELARVSSQL